MDKQLQMTVPKGNECDRNGPVGDGLVELRRLWEVESYFICPIVGICVPLDDQHRLLKRVGICIRNKTAFEIHELLVAACASENRLSEKLEHLLYRKFREESVSLFEMDEDAFVTMTIKANVNGEFAFGIPRAGWWGFCALGVGPVKTHQEKELSQNAVIWIPAFAGMTPVKIQYL